MPIVNSPITDGPAHPSEIYVIDNGGELRYYLTARALAAAIYDGYASDASHIYQKRKPSIQHFGPQGINDLSTYINYDAGDPDVELAQQGITDIAGINKFITRRRAMAVKALTHDLALLLNILIAGPTEQSAE